jgi:hypothetical protein
MRAGPRSQLAKGFALVSLNPPARKKPTFRPVVGRGCSWTFSGHCARLSNDAGSPTNQSGHGNSHSILLGKARAAFADRAVGNHLRVAIELSLIVAVAIVAVVIARILYLCPMTV